MMSRSRLAVAALVAAFALGPGVSPWPAFAQGRDEIVSAARTVIGGARYATLVTLDASGRAQARVVDPFTPENDFTVWVGTNSRSRKVAEIRRDPRVTLLYFDRDGEAFVTLIGRATLVDDAARKATYWKEAWKAFYKDTFRGDDYLLLRVVPERLEIVAPSLGMNNDPTTWAPVSIDLGKGGRQ